MPSLTRARPARRVFAVFGLTILLPGLLLIALGARSLGQERASAERDADTRLGRAADAVARALDRELTEWRDASRRAPAGPSRGTESLPDSLRDAAREPGALAFVTMSTTGAAAWPSVQLPYALEVQPTRDPPVASSPAFLRAEIAELQARDYLTASSLYRQLLTAAAAVDRPLLLHRLGRTAHAAGSRREAASHFAELQRYRDPITGGVPADLAAAYELCALAAEPVDRPRLSACATSFYGDLAGSRWSIERSQYLFYSSRAREWMDMAGARDEALDKLRQHEGRRLALGEVVEALIDERSSSEAMARPAAHAVAHGGYLVVSWPGAEPNAGATAVVVSRAWFHERVVPSLVSAAVEAGVEVALTSEDGVGLVPVAAGVSAGADTSIERRVRIAGFDVRARAWPTDPSAWSADLARRQTFFLALLGLVALVMASGAYFTIRVVRHELAVAQLKADFVAAVSHEFRSPLTGIRQLGELLMRGRVPSEERRQEYYARITRESDRLSRLVEHLLDFARMEAGRREYRMAPVDVRAWIDDVVATFRSRSEDGAAQVHVTVGASLPAIQADAEALACAVHNLLDNAVKYSPGRPAVWLDVDGEAGGIELRVRDEGEGMSDADRARIFDTFYRGANTRDRHVTGAGIGLGLVRHIVAAHRGRIECESRVGAGTTFTVHLPAGAVEDLSPVGASADLARAKSSSR